MTGLQAMTDRDDKAKKAKATYIAQAYTDDTCMLCTSVEQDIYGNLFCPHKGEDVDETGTCDVWEQA